MPQPTTSVPPGVRPTIREVAGRAGVSHQTVSRYLKFDGQGLKPATLERVKSAIDELGYRPNLVARSMRTRTTGRLAVLTPALAFNPARMLAGASSTAHAAGYAVDVMSPAGGGSARAARIHDLIDSRQVDGILSLAPVPADALGTIPSDVAVVVSADFDDEMRGIGPLADSSPLKAIIEHLADLGHRRLYHVSGSTQFASARARITTFTETISRLGLESAGVYTGDWTGESGIAAMRSLEPPYPTAVLAASDIVAAGVIRGALERGWSVPGDLSVTGWDNHEIGQYLYPSLTTVDVNLELLGSNGMARLLASLRGEKPVLSDQPLSRIIWRESVGPAPASPAR